MSRAAIIIIVAAFALSPLLVDRLHPNQYEGGRSREAGAAGERNTSAVARMLGEFRTAASDIMFIKTERYLHSGVAYEPHLTHATLTTVGTIEEIEDEHADASTKRRLVTEPGSAGIAQTLIPAAEGDWRGIVGRLHRSVKPWRDPSEPHLLTDGRELLPWFRLMTLTDPHYVRGYAVGGWWLQRRNLDAAFAFVQEGATNNPAAFEILYTLGQLHLERGRRANSDNLMNPNAASLPHFLAARDTFVRAADIALTQRPPGWVDDPKNPQQTWTTQKEDDARGSAHMAALCEKNYGDPTSAAAIARRYLAVFPDDEVLRNLARPPPAP